MQQTLVTNQQNYFRLDCDECIIFGFRRKNSRYPGTYTLIAFGVVDSLSVTTVSEYFNHVLLASNTDVLDILDILKPDDKPIVFDAANADAHSPAFQVCTVTGLSHPLHRIHKTHSAHKIHKTHMSRVIRFK